MDIFFFKASEEKVPLERRFRNKARPDATEEKVPLERGSNGHLFLKNHRREGTFRKKKKTQCTQETVPSDGHLFL